MEKLDYKKAYRDLYLPKQKPMLIEVPQMQFIMVDGKGAPQDEEYQKAMQALYALSFTIKMSKMSGEQPEGYFEYVVPPLEGLWSSGNKALDITSKSSWHWTSMIRQPEFVTKEVFEWSLRECKRKKPEVDISKAYFQTFAEGLCVQMMHIGPYCEETKTVSQLEEFIVQQGLIDSTGHIRRHHEIYLSDPRKTAPEKLKTVLRLPVDKI